MTYACRQEKHLLDNALDVKYDFSKAKRGKFTYIEESYIQQVAARDFLGKNPTSSPSPKQVNQQILDLGLPWSHYHNEDAVDRHVEYLMANFHLFMVAEKMDESLIMLRHLMNWTIEDVVGFRHGEEVDKEEPMIPWTKYQNVKFQNWQDKKLYRAAVKKLDNQVNLDLMNSLQNNNNHKRKI